MRMIYRCRSKACKAVWAREYPHRHESRGAYGKRFVRWTDDRGMEPGERECPKCKTPHPRSERVQGFYSDKHECDARCLSAIGHQCECSCGGKNHGKDHVIAA